MSSIFTFEKVDIIEFDIISNYIIYYKCLQREQSLRITKLRAISLSFSVNKRPAHLQRLMCCCNARNALDSSLVNNALRKLKKSQICSTIMKGSGFGKQRPDLELLLPRFHSLSVRPLYSTGDVAVLILLRNAGPLLCPQSLAHTAHSSTFFTVSWVTTIRSIMNRLMLRTTRC